MDFHYYIIEVARMDIFIDQGIGLHDLEHPHQNWETVKESARELNMDPLDPMDRLWARLHASNSLAAKSTNHPILSYKAVDQLAHMSQQRHKRNCRNDEIFCEVCNALDLLIHYTRRHIWKQCSYFSWTKNIGIDPQDLQQIAYIGLLISLKTWKIDGGKSFLHWSKYYIRQEMRNHLTNNGPLVRIPYHKRQLQTQLRRIRSELSELLQRDPSYSELSQYIHDLGKSGQKHPISESELSFLEMYSEDSLNRIINSDNESDLELQDLISSNWPDFVEEICRRQLIEELIGSLTDIEQTVIRNYRSSPIGHMEAKDIVEILPNSPKSGKPYTESGVGMIYKRCLDKMKEKAKELGFYSIADFY